MAHLVKTEQPQCGEIIQHPALHSPPPHTSAPSGHKPVNKVINAYMY